MKGGIYTIRFEGTPKFYVGKTCNLRARKTHHMSHLRRGVHKNPHLQNIFNALGADAMMFCIEERTDDENERTTREQAWMDEHRDSGLLINVHMFSVVEDIGAILPKGRIAWNRGLPSPFKGVPRTEEDKAAIGAGNRGKCLGRKFGPRPDDVRQRIAEAHLGKTMSEEARLAMSAGKTGKKTGPRPDDVKAKISASNKGRVFTEAHRKALSDAARARRAQKND